MSPTELHSVDSDLHKEIKAIRNFFCRSSPIKNSLTTKCDLCLSPFNCESSFISDNTFAVIRHFFLIKLNSVSYSPFLCPECAKYFVHLSGLFHELSRLRSEFNSCRRELGRRIISTSAGTPGDPWEEEISKTENTYPCCVEINCNGSNHVIRLARNLIELKIWKVILQPSLLKTRERVSQKLLVTI